jgi:hypothetical protein
LRARAGFATQRADIVVESVASYTQLAAGMARSGVIGQENLRRDATALEAMLADAERLPGADAARIAEVRAKVAALVPAS